YLRKYLHMINFRLKRVAEQLQVRAAHILVRSGLPLHQRWLPLYHFLIQEGPHAVTDIASSIGLSHPAVLQFSQEMVEAGLVASYRDPQDRRKRVLALTAAGKQLKPQFLDYLREADDLMASFFAGSGIDIDVVLTNIEQSLARRAL
ncbi:MAG: MarR family transcriptional regulator, partial [Pseudomonadota bacterium]